MYYAEGGNLDDAAPRLDWIAKKRIVVEVALGLGYLHSQGIIHRDIKGGNIVLTKNDEAKLCDFGIAKIIASATCGSSFVRKGTPKFMAPELKSAKPAYSTMSDIHALGVVMQELMHEDEIPLDYMAIMTRCLDEDPEKRPTVEEIVGAFDVDHRVHVVDAEGDQLKTAQGLSADADFFIGCIFYLGWRGDGLYGIHVEALASFAISPNLQNGSEWPLTKALRLRRLNLVEYIKVDWGYRKITTELWLYFRLQQTKATLKRASSWERYTMKERALRKTMKRPYGGFVWLPKEDVHVRKS
ncbi:Mitogen-activated protein kinase kinase kinase kinase 5 [Dissophora globulifera]|nr:Mitogen-activated protein kinase kinase kinase kinase 5 [Dissophora globulifera]